jgi:hypothetical protein
LGMVLVLVPTGWLMMHRPTDEVMDTSV